MQIILMNINEFDEYQIMPKGTKFLGSGKLVLNGDCQNGVSTHTNPCWMYFLASMLLKTEMVKTIFSFKPT